MIKEFLEYASEYRLTKIKTFKGRQGIGFDATLLRNGIEIGSISDEANGGALHINVRDSEEKNLLDNYAQTKIISQFEITEHFLDELVNYETLIKKLSSHIKKMVPVAILDKTPDDNGVPTNILIYKCPYTPENVEKIKKKDPNIYFLNEDFALLDIPKQKKLKAKK